MITLYRAVSQAEKDDYFQRQEFRLAKNTLEAKQFFKSKGSVKKFVSRAELGGYDPKYVCLLIIGINEECLKRAMPTYMELDGFDAVVIQEDDLLTFNNCVTFVKQEDL